MNAPLSTTERAALGFVSNAARRMGAPASVQFNPLAGLSPDTLAYIVPAHADALAAAHEALTRAQAAIGEAVAIIGGAHLPVTVGHLLQASGMIGASGKWGYLYALEAMSAKATR